MNQLVGAATSVGANYCEANDSVSGKDFKKSIGTCRKESRESMFFLRMIGTAEPSLAADARELWREAKELNLIFGAIWRKAWTTRLLYSRISNLGFISTFGLRISNF